MLSWEDEFAMYLPSLTSLDITGNVVMPHGHVLESKALKEIKGITWDGDCTNCVLLRNYSYHGNGYLPDLTVEDLKQREFVRGFKGDCRAIKYKVKNTSMTFAKHGFFPVCVAQDEKCFHSEISVTPIHRCWATDNNVLNVEFLIGTLGLLLNVTVFVTTFSVKSLRSNVSMLLIGNMAISDFLISAYSVAITSARKLPYVKFLTIMTDFCRFWGLVWLLGQLVTVTTSVLLTLERYWAVIYYANPSKRMTSRRAVAGIIFCWLVALALAVLPLVGVGVYTSNTYCIPIRPRRDIPRMFEFSIALTLIGIILYFITLPLYFKMYLFVRKSCHQMRVGRESALAKRIALLVITNMVFFMFPVVLALLWLVSDAFQKLPPIFEEILTGVVPTICFTINSFINPLLSAFRHERFKQSLRKRKAICALGLGRSCCSKCTATREAQSEMHESDNKESNNENHFGVRKDNQLIGEECITHL